MKTIFRTSLVVASLLAGTSAVSAAPGPSAVAGRWDAVLTRNGVDIPFRLDIKADGQNVQGIFYDGFKPYDGTTSATFKDGNLVLNVDHYLTTISARLENGQLNGNVVAQGRESSAGYGFRAVRHVDAPPSNIRAPQIAGNWEIPLAAPSSKGEKAFRFIVQQQGDEVSASILRIDGDTGAYTGNFKDGKWVLSHFDGGRPGVIVVTPRADGTLEVAQQVDRPKAAAEAAHKPASTNEYAADATPDGRYAETLVAYRTEVARANGFAQPDDFLTHTKVNDPNAVFTFAFPDNDGKIVTNEDPRFKDKVVLAVVTGTWCPNCHDEAQYLAKLDKEYRGKGLAIVALNFEEPEQQETLKRQKAFVKQYGIEYTYLEAGSPAQMWEKVPQLAHLDTWPATVFIGRDGKVRAIHSGFASPASGDFHAQLQRDFKSRIDQLLAEQTPASVAEAAPQPATTLASR